MEKYIKEYLEELRLDGKTPNTMDAYRRDLVHFTGFLKEEGLELEDFDEIEVSHFIGYLLDLNMKRATISRHLVSIRNFYKYLRKKNRIAEAPVLYFDLPEIKRALPEVLTVEEVEELINTPDPLTRKGRRDRAILELLYAAGLKATELLDLNVRDVDLSKGYVHVQGKKNRERQVPIGHFAVRSIKEYLSEREDPKGGDVLFPSLRGERMSRQGLWKILKETADRCGIQENINLNTLRHSYAVHMLSGGADITTVSLLLGHNDIKATSVYLKLVKSRKFKEVYEDAHPRA